MIQHRKNLNLIPGRVPVRIKVNQYDHDADALIFYLHDGANIFTAPVGAACIIEGQKPDKTGFQYGATIEGSTVTADLTPQMTILAGEVVVELRVSDANGNEIGTSNFIIEVEPAALGSDTVISETDLPIIKKAAENVDLIMEKSAQVQADAEQVALDKQSAIAARAGAETAQTAAETAQAARAGAETAEGNAESWANEARIYAERVRGRVVYIGSVTFANLPTTGMEAGDQYNISDSFVTDSRFVEGAGLNVPAGTDVTYGEDGKWNLAAAPGVNTFNGRKGNVQPQENDYSINQIKATGTEGQVPMLNEQGKLEMADLQGGNGGTYTGTCTGQAANQNKIVTVPATQNFELKEGVMIGVKFDATNTYSATAEAPVTLNVNNTGAKQIYGSNSAAPTGTNTIYFGRANYVNFYQYDGTYWVWAGSSTDTNTTYTPQALGFGYGTCDTEEATSAKVVTLSGYSLVKNGIVAVKFVNAVPANATLNINSKGAKNIFYKGAKITDGIIKSDDLATFIYDGTQYHLIGIDRSSGETQLNTFRLSVDSWTANTDTVTATDYPYIYEISSTLYNSNSTPIWDLAGAATIPTSNERESIDMILEAVFTSSGITLYATDAPQVALTLRVKGV